MSEEREFQVGVSREEGFVFKAVFGARTLPEKIIWDRPEKEYELRELRAVRENLPGPRIWI
jgi:hypothetical protein